MKLIFAGTSHGIPEHDRFCTSTFLVIGDSTYIIDAGAPISPLLLRYGLTHHSVKGIFITHPHEDHFDGLAEYCNQISWYYRTACPEIYLPSEEIREIHEHWVEVNHGGSHDNVHLSVFQEGKVYQDENITVTARKTRHCENAYAFYVEAEGKKILFTGDMSTQYPEYPSLFCGIHYDLVIGEAAHHELGTAGPVYEKTDADRLIVTHVQPQKGAALAKQMEDFSFPACLAYDGMTIEL